MRTFPGSLQRRQKLPIPSSSSVQALNETSNSTEAFIDISIDGFSVVETINLTIVDNLESGSQTGVLTANRSSATGTSGSGLPLTQMPPFLNGSAFSTRTPYMPTGFATNPTPSLPPMSISATTVSNFTGGPGPAGSGQTDGSVSLLMVIFRAIFGG